MAYTHKNEPEPEPKIKLKDFTRRNDKRLEELLVEFINKSEKELDKSEKTK